VRCEGGELRRDGQGELPSRLWKATVIFRQQAPAARLRGLTASWFCEWKRKGNTYRGLAMRRNTGKKTTR
jgi:hypothetical protein